MMLFLLYIFNVVKNVKLSKICYFCAIGFGLGRMHKKTPTGTIASFLAIPIWWVLVYFFSYLFYFVFIIIGMGLGIYFCDCANKIIGSHDHKSIVWDEFVGMWITLIIIPMYSWIWVVVAFSLFRLLDIIKPYPISWCDQKINGGFGIMIDDICAGVMSVCIISCLMVFFN